MTEFVRCGFSIDKTQAKPRISTGKNGNDSMGLDSQVLLPFQIKTICARSSSDDNRGGERRQEVKYKQRAAGATTKTAAETAETAAATTGATNGESGDSDGNRR